MDRSDGITSLSDDRGARHQVGMGSGRRHSDSPPFRVHDRVMLPASTRLVLNGEEGPLNVTSEQRQLRARVRPSLVPGAGHQHACDAGCVGVSERPPQRRTRAGP